MTVKRDWKRFVMLRLPLLFEERKKVTLSEKAVFMFERLRDFYRKDLFAMLAKIELSGSEKEKVRNLEYEVLFAATDEDVRYFHLPHPLQKGKYHLYAVHDDYVVRYLTSGGDEVLKMEYLYYALKDVSLTLEGWKSK